MMIYTNTQSEDVIRIENVSVRYRLPAEQIHPFKGYAIRFLQGRIQYKDFNALQDVSLKIRKGEIWNYRQEWGWEKHPA